MTIPSAKEMSAKLLALLNVPESEFDFEQYSKAVDEFATELLVELGSKITPKTSDERLTALVREYCQRFDGVAHRVEQAPKVNDSMFPLFRGGLFAKFAHQLTQSENIRMVLPILEAVLRGLPYGSDDAIVEAIMANIRQRGRVERSTHLAAVKGEISNLLDGAVDASSLQSRVLEVTEIIRREGNSTDLQMFFYIKLAEKYQELTASK